MNRKFLGLSTKVWIGIIALGVVVFIYVKRQGGSTAKTATGAGDGGVDESQLSSDIVGQITSALGGTPGGETGGFDYGWLESLFQQQQASLAELLTSSGAVAGGGISGAGGTGVTGSIPAAAGSSISVSANAPDAPSPVAPTDVANPATSFYAPGSGVAMGGPSPLYVYSGGLQVAESPIAGSVFSVSTPASAGYEALGVKASDPITFVPTPMGSGTPADPRPIAPTGKVVAV